MKTYITVSLVIILIVLVTFNVRSYYLMKKKPEGFTINSTDPNINQQNINKILDILPKAAAAAATAIPNIIPSIVTGIKSVKTVNINPVIPGSPDTTLQTLKINVNGQTVRTDKVAGLITNMINQYIKNIGSIDIEV